MCHSQSDAVMLHKLVRARGISLWPLQSLTVPSQLLHLVILCQRHTISLPFMNNFSDSRALMLYSLPETEVETAIKAFLTNTKLRSHVAQ